MKKPLHLHVSETSSFDSKEAFADHLALLLTNATHDLGNVDVFKLPDQADTLANCPLSLRSVVFSFTPIDKSLRDKFAQIYDGYEGKFLFEVDTFSSGLQTKDGLSAQIADMLKQNNWLSFHLTAITTFPRQSLNKRAIHSKGDTISFSYFRSAISSVIASIKDEVEARNRLKLSELRIRAIHDACIPSHEPIALSMVSKTKNRLRYEGSNGERMSVIADIEADDSFNVEFSGLSEVQVKELLKAIGVLRK